MRTETAPQMRLADYRPYPFAVDTVRLVFSLDPERTIVEARMAIRRTGAPDAPLLLNGEGLKLEAIAIDGKPLGASRFELSETGLAIADVPDRFELSTKVTISPKANTALSGLYISGGRYCSQCEAEGFRRITFWPDRPDVMSRFSVRIEADKADCPILLSNGSPGETGPLPKGRHFAEWDDPHPKPSYLFALCAGDYDVLHDSFTTMEDREVGLAIYVDKGDGPRAAYAMDALKRSMKWDEEVFGRAYDLDVFNIVAVRDFNFGAMENKGLNIFNSAYILADAETATDADFEAIESVVAHEYFHNWTGNRITCRDWFQLCLKEGLTVFRDQEFSSDMRSRAVQRIKDVIRLRARQFPEDSGPLAHPVRPVELGSIDNLYTATVYEKGAELIRVLKNLIGDEAFARGMDLYFDRHDGEAVTIEDFYACFAETSGQDLSGMLDWYAQPGTPEVKVDFDPAGGELRLSQSVPGNSQARALPIPLDFAVIDRKSGATLADQESASARLLDGRSLRIRLPEGLPDDALLSFNRGFAAPVRVRREQSLADEIALVERDADPFNQWNDAQRLMRHAIHGLIGSGEVEPDPAVIEAVRAAAERNLTDPALAALILRLPTVAELFLDRDPADAQAIDTARRRVKAALASAVAPIIEKTLSVEEPAPFRPDAEQAGQRALRGAAMSLISARADADAATRLKERFAAAHSMTESLAALHALVDLGDDVSSEPLAAFEARWKDNPNVIDKWFAAQALAGGEGAVDRVAALTQHPAFDLRTPNRVRSVLAAFAMQNLPAFHRPDGAGHRLLADMVREIDLLNPALAARLLTAFEQWKRLAGPARMSARDTLEGLSRAKLSRNAGDIISRALG
jgi:aminopeptidase N